MSIGLINFNSKDKIIRKCPDLRLPNSGIPSNCKSMKFAMKCWMAEVVKAPVLLVEIAPAGVQIPVVPAMEMDVGVTPSHRRWPNSPDRLGVEDQQNDS